MLEIRNVKKTDLERIHEIEHICFPKLEAASYEKLEQRIKYVPDTFLVLEAAGQIIGFINAVVVDQKLITDDLFDNAKENPSVGGYVAILGLCVHPDYQHQGYAAMLLNELIKQAKANKRTGLTLTCKDYLIQYYCTFGFENMGISESVLGGVSWYDLVYEL
ncbi:GNAT family N-acetyltransferase [Erysipelotrichaceae bacterium OttesenSCG-928-M19]|nr:GNAT family N-acetyltransferase [Erysipelotrichaceae bacterium OttesenSCG-928-M19]